MSDTTISPIKVATAAVAGAAATEAAVLTKNFVAKKYAQMPADAFIKKTATGINTKLTSLKTSITNKINKQTIRDGFNWVSGKLKSAKETVVNAFTSAKTTITKKAGEFAGKPAVQKVIKFAKNPMVIGAALGVIAYLGVSKLLDKINNNN